MRKTGFLRNEWFRSLMMAFLLVAALLIILGGQQFVDASLRMQSNPAYLAQTGGDPLTLDSDGQAQGLVAAGIEYRDLLAQRNRALILAGSGLVLLGAGW